jgi:hypothetical protein
MQVTTLQAEMLKNIALDECNPLNGGRPEIADDAHTWASNIIRTAQDKGVFTSLQNANLAWHNGCEGMDAVVYLTEKGFAAFQAL